MAMREILFRGKTGRLWAYGHVRKLGNKTFMYEVDGYPSVVVDPDTVGQYTGLTDKNGKKAFEGDCINYHFGPEIGIIRYGRYRNTFNDDQFAEHIGFYVEWHGPQANSLRKDLGFWLSLNGVSIIGNIHDNPELMEGE